MNGYDIVSNILLEKSKSKAQQRFMGMVYAVKKHGMPAPSKGVADVAKGISEEEARKFAETKTKGLPEHVAKKSAKSK